MSSGTAVRPLSPLIPLSRPKFNFPSKFTINKPFSLAKICCSQNSTPEQQQLNLSVLRFTLGIPGLDESYLPRYIGYAFGTLLVLNHFVGLDSSSITPAQLRTEVFGLSLAVFSAVVPYLGKFLKGASPRDQKSLPEGAEQIFAMSQDIADNMKEDLAWGTYILLRNTNSISVLISVQDALCVRGYWNTPKDLSKENIPDWFREQIKKIGFSNLKDTMYFQQAADSELKEMVPEGTRSLLVQPILRAPRLSPNQTEKCEGFLLLASSIDYAYTDKDKAWIAAIANKFSGFWGGLSWGPKDVKGMPEIMVKLRVLGSTEYRLFEIEIKEFQAGPALRWAEWKVDKHCFIAVLMEMKRMIGGSFGLILHVLISNTIY